jgi:hypothetical protein
MRLDIKNHKSLYKHVMRKLDDIESDEDLILFEMDLNDFIDDFIEKYYDRNEASLFFIDKRNKKWFERTWEMYPELDASDLFSEGFNVPDEDVLVLYREHIRRVVLDCLGGQRLYMSIKGDEE